MTNYLYGASVQGIQNFIFQTGKLKEIVGASEIVEQICKDSFLKFLKDNGLDDQNLKFIFSSAGNIRLLTQSLETVERIVRKWPQTVQALAPGMTLSQAVNCYDVMTADTMTGLEQKLKTQRKQAPIPAELAPMAAVRARRTGKPAVDWKDENGAPRDQATRKKQEAGQINAPANLMKKSIPEGFTKHTNLYPFNIEDICKEQKTGWVAVIHADGNGLGNIIRTLVANLKNDPQKLENAFQQFSQSIENATLSAVQSASATVALQAFENEKLEKYPFRPVIIGGDDLTLIIRADLAVDYSIAFLREFELQTQKNLAVMADTPGLEYLKNGLTACAGIAFMKPSYPFHYGYDLAEALCADAKNGFNRQKSAFSFHKIQDSFVESYPDIIQRELSPKDDISFKYGPYDFDMAKELTDMVNTMRKKDAPKSGIRKWLSCLHQDTEQAKFWLERVIEIAGPTYADKLQLEEAVSNGKTHLYDVMSLVSIMKGDAS